MPAPFARSSTEKSASGRSAKSRSAVARIACSRSSVMRQTAASGGVHVFGLRREVGHASHLSRRRYMSAKLLIKTNIDSVDSLSIFVS